MTGSEGLAMTRSHLAGMNPATTVRVKTRKRVMGFEPTTSCLGSKHSTAELHPQLNILSNWRGVGVKGGKKLAY